MFLREVFTACCYCVAVVVVVVINVVAAPVNVFKRVRLAMQSQLFVS